MSNYIEELKKLKSADLKKRLGEIKAEEKMLRVILRSVEVREEVEKLTESENNKLATA